MNSSYATTSLLQGLKDAGISYNTDLSKFYTKYRKDRPSIGMFGQDWTLPEPAVKTYSDSMLNKAKSYSDTAVLVIARSGGEGADLPTDMGKVEIGKAGTTVKAGKFGITGSHYINNSSDYADYKAGDSYLDLSQTEKDLVSYVTRNFKKVVLVYNGANDLNLSFVSSHPQIKSVLWCPPAGQTGFKALGEVLTGKINPSGHLAETWPLHYEDVPSAGNFPVADRDSVYKEGPFIGYRYYTTAHVPVRYPFGYGLSYSTFEYSLLQVDGNGVTFTVRNSSQIAGDALPQMYIGRNQATSGILRPARELKAFSKIHLEPGESKQVRFDFDLYTFRHFDPGTASWQVEAGAWDIWIGSDANTLCLHATHVVQGTIEPGHLSEQWGHYIGADIRHVTDSEVSYLLGHTVSKYTNSGVFQSNDAISSWAYSPSWLARKVVKVLQSKEDKAVKKTGSPDLNILFVLNMPPRAMAKMTGGRISPDMVTRGILDIPNKHLWRGIGHLISGYFRNKKDNKKTQEDIEK